MLSLLGVAMSHDLLAESKIFLHLFLISIIRPSPRNGIRSAVSHPDCHSYFVVLYEEWFGLFSVGWRHGFTRRAFVAIMLDVLVVYGPRQVWTCNLVTRLPQHYCTLDFGCFLTFSQGSIEAINKWSNHADEDPAEDGTPFSRLAKWTGVVTSDFFAIDRSVKTDNTRVGQFNSIADIIVSAFKLQV